MSKRKLDSVDSLNNIDNLVENKVNHNNKKVKMENESESSNVVEIKEEIKENINYDNLEALIPASWRKHLEPEFKKTYWINLKKNLNRDLKSDHSCNIFPKIPQIFYALSLCSFESASCLILGQDPYHSTKINDDGEEVCDAHGLAFSVEKGLPIPPSLRNIYTELESDVKDYKRPDHGNLEKWAKQGVLLLNATLTVKQGEANSHQSYGWATFTDAIINLLNAKKSNFVFLLWGGFAQNKAQLVSAKKHLVLKAAHPSPMAGTRFLGCKHFSKTNEYLGKYGKKKIYWQN